MAKSKILIVDDDNTVATAISEAFIRSGFETIIETKGKRALSTLRVEKINGVVVDCMIPGINGVDLATKMREEINFQKNIVLISGIFKDQKFADSSIKKAAATDFLFKPLDLDKLVAIFKQEEDSVSGGASDWLDKILNKTYEQERFIISIGKSDILPLLTLLKKQSASVKTHFLDYRIDMLDGEIVNIDAKGKYNTVVQKILNLNYTTQDILNRYVNKNDEICEQLISRSIVSPHLITDIQNDILNSALNDFLFDETTINFDMGLAPLNQSNLKSKLTIKNENFIYLDYINKMTDQDKESYKKSILNFGYSVNHAYKNDRELLSFPIFQVNAGLIPEMEKHNNVNELFHETTQEEMFDLFYLLTVKGYITFGESQVSEKELENLANRLSLILKGVEGKSPEQVFKFLGVDDSRAIFVATFFKTFAKLNHPDKIPSAAPQSLIDLNQKVFSIVSEAHGILTDPKRKEKYENEIKSKETEKILMAESIKEKGQSYLSRSKYKEALHEFEKARSMHDEPMLTLYYYWCYLKVHKRIEDKKERLDIYNELIAFEIEDKRNELYSLVMGIFYKRSKKYQDALDEFEKSLGYNKNFLPARREIMNLKSQLEKAGKADSILSNDISTVVTGFFKKKA